MRSTFNLMLASCILTAAAAYGALPEIPETNSGASLWKSKRQETIRSLLSQRDDIKIPQLGEMLRQLERLNYRDCPEKHKIIKQLQRSLITIPGHAEYYRDSINSTRSELEKALEVGELNAIGSIRGTLSNKVMYGFQTLTHLPSPETVGVLGEFLFDERGFVDISVLPPSEQNLYLGIKDSPVFAHAARTLDALPIVAKPVGPGTRYRTPGDTEPWRQWYRQIKDGKRTFRFEGDPVEYDLNGPAPGQKVDRIARDTKRERERTAGRKDTGPRGGQPMVSSVETPSKSVPAALIAAGALALGTLVWYVSRTRVSGKP